MDVQLGLPHKGKNVRGYAIAQAVRRRLPTAVARIRSQVRSCGICGGQSGIGAGFLRVLRFPLPISIPPTTPHSSPIIQGWYNRPNIGRRTKWTQSHPTPRNMKKKKGCLRTERRNKFFHLRGRNKLKARDNFIMIKFNVYSTPNVKIAN
jgi:hypothetical protein